MGELGLTKVLGALLATALGLMGLKALSDFVFASGGGEHGGHHEEVSLTEQMKDKFHYAIDVEEAAGGGVEAVAAVFDLGAALASADVAKGEKIFKAQCSTCHTATAGGANGTGPNLHGIVGGAKAARAGFSYSAALTGLGSNWSYENLDAWIKQPAAYAKGTSMSFAGIRKDGDRAAVIAYLAKETPGAPAFPAPLAVAAPAAPAEGAPPAEGAVAPPAEGTAPVAPEAGTVQPT